MGFPTLASFSPPGLDLPSLSFGSSFSRSRSLLHLPSISTLQLPSQSPNSPTTLRELLPLVLRAIQLTQAAQTQPSLVPPSSPSLSPFKLKMVHAPSSSFSDSNFSSETSSELDFSSISSYTREFCLFFVVFQSSRRFGGGDLRSSLTCLLSPSLLLFSCFSSSQTLWRITIGLSSFKPNALRSKLSTGRTRTSSSPRLGSNEW